jgi:hypothetical protein
MLTSVRAGCRTPNGIERDEARGMYAARAKRLGISADALITLAMGGDWQVTPPHPAYDLDNPNRAADYEALLKSDGWEAA